MSLITWVRERVRGSRGADARGLEQTATPPRRIDLAAFAPRGAYLPEPRALLRGLTLERMQSIFDGASLDIRDQMQLAEAIEESHDHVAGTLELRRSAVNALRRVVHPGDPADERSVAAADLARDLVERDWFEGALDCLLGAILPQYAAIEILYREETIAGRTLWMPSGWLDVESDRWGFDAAQQPIFYRDLPASPGDSANAVTPVAGRFVIHTHRARPRRPGERALVRSIAALWFLGKLGLTQWGRMVDKYGLPFVSLQYTANQTAAQINDVIRALLSYAAERVAATPEGTTLTMQDVPDQTPHEAFQDFSRRAISKLLLGQDSAQSAMDGQKTGANLAGEVRDVIRNADARQLAASLNGGLLRPWCAWNFGDGVAPPRIEFTPDETPDPEARSRVFAAARGLGLPIKREQVYGDLGLEQPAPGDELLEQGLPLEAGATGAGSGDEGTEGRRDEGNALRREPLSGIQITSAIDVLGKVTDETISRAAAIELLGALGFERGAAQTMVAAQKLRTRDVSVEDVLFKRDMIRAFLADGTVNDIIYNLTDVVKLLEQLNVPIEPGYIPPWAPVQDATGRELTGAVIRDDEGDIIGADVVDAPPPAVGGFGAIAARQAKIQNPNSPMDTAAVRAMAALFARRFAAARNALENADRVLTDDDAAKAERARATLPELLRDIDSGDVGELLHLATWERYLAGRVRELGGERAALRGATQNHCNHRPLAGATQAHCNPQSDVVVAAAGDEAVDPDLVRERFEEAIRAHADKLVAIDKETFLKLEGANRARAFTVARVADAQLLGDLYNAVGRAIDNGESYREFVDSLNAIQEQRGWGGLEPWHAKLVYEQNVGMAYTVGRYDQARSSGATHWRYLPSQAATPRADHQRYYGQVFRMGEGPMPPLDFGCQCEWEPVFEDELDGVEVQGEPPRVPEEQEFRFAPADYFEPPTMDITNIPDAIAAVIRSAT